MALLNLEQLRAVPALETRDVDVPELGGTVRVRAWTGADRDEWNHLCLKRPKDGDGDPRGIRAAAIVVSLVDEDGKRLLSAKDVAIVDEWADAAVETVWNVVRETNRIGNQAVEEAEKN